MPDDSQRLRGVRASRWTKRRRRIALTAAIAAGLAVCTTLTVANAQSRGPGDGGVRKGLERLVHKDDYPAALASSTGRDGRTHNYTAGVADLKTKAKVPVDGQVRAGSNTKPFTAAVVLQLAGEGKIDLEAPVERYLPNLVRGEGIDGRRITVHQLLQHTSGLPDYAQFMEAPNGKGRHLYVQPRSMLDLALSHKANFEPGKGWSYSNTNYLLAGLIIEKVTGRPLAEEIDHRVIQRAGLRHTYFPAPGDESIRGAHPEGYLAVKPGAPLEKITKMDPSAAWAAGQLISTPSDLNRFFTALFDGKLLKPAQLKQMRTTVPAPGLWPGARYGLGVISTPLSCGGLMWGHGGDISGYHTLGGVTDGGRAVTVAVTADGPSSARGPADVQAVVDTALCK
ncbi:serine hydrolase domain-containing protein [Streptomyces varsoviensis]|uniref:serine hydrolase domain-containing protein n=1 Tax=Streptomyces varsoviensis TaxID=67373 RepID=UPI0033D2804A